MEEVKKQIQSKENPNDTSGSSVVIGCSKCGGKIVSDQQSCMFVCSQCGKVCEEEKAGGNLTESDKVAPLQDKALEAQNGAIASEKEREEQERTTIKKKLFILHFKKSLGSVKYSCEQAGISRETYYEWKKTDSDFYREIQSAFAQKLEDVEERLNKQILADNPSMIRYYLDRRHPLYRPRLKVEGPKPGEESLEDEFDKFLWNEEESYGDSKTNNESSASDRNDVQHSEQTGEDTKVSIQPGSGVLLEKENTQKSSVESEAERDQQSN